MTSGSKVSVPVSDDAGIGCAGRSAMCLATAMSGRISLASSAGTSTRFIRSSIRAT